MSSAHLLGLYMAECSERQFSWRDWNCAHFAFGWAQRVTGIDGMAGLPPTPSGPAAARVTRRIGATLADAVQQRLGFEPCDPACARVGDMVLIDHKALGICTGQQAVVLLVGGGIGFVPLREATHAWRVGP